MSVDVILCPKCQAFAAECETPIGDGAETLCWLCAHDVVKHGATMEMGPSASCGCSKHEIYPAHVIEAREANAKAAERGYKVRPEFMGRDSERVLETRRERVMRVTASYRTGEHPTQN